MSFPDSQSSISRYGLSLGPQLESPDGQLHLAVSGHLEINGAKAKLSIPAPTSKSAPLSDHDSHHPLEVQGHKLALSLFSYIHPFSKAYKLCLENTPQSYLSPSPLPTTRVSWSHFNRDCTRALSRALPIINAVSQLDSARLWGNGDVKMSSLPSGLCLQSK